VGQERLLTVEEACKVLRITSKTLRRHLKEGRVKGVRIGRVWRIDEEVLKDVLENGIIIKDESKITRLMA
jgi:excisionase family DNA binding protein